MSAVQLTGGSAYALHRPLLLPSSIIMRDVIHFALSTVIILFTMLYCGPFTLFIARDGDALQLQEKRRKMHESKLKSRLKIAGNEQRNR